jgi:hypothetical protein
MNSGRPSRAAERRDLAEDRALLDALLWDADTLRALAALPAMEARVRGGPPADTASARAWARTAFDVAQWRLGHGDTSGVRAAIAGLRAMTFSGRAARLERDGVVLLLDAQLAAALRRPDAAALRLALDSVLALGPYGGHLRVVGNLAVSRLFEQAGDLPRAYAAALRWAPAPGVADMTFFSTYLREQGRLAERLGRREEAVRAYRHYLAIRPAPDPSVRAVDAQVRRALRRLEGTRG